MRNQLVGLPVALTVSDPWDFVTVHGSGPFHGKILSIGTPAPGAGWGTEAAALIRLDKPLVYQGEVFEFLIASPRLSGSHVADLLVGRRVGCALANISADKATSGRPFDLKDWQGGGLDASIEAKQG